MMVADIFSWSFLSVCLIMFIARTIYELKRYKELTPLTTVAWLVIFVSCFAFSIGNLFLLE